MKRDLPDGKKSVSEESAQEKTVLPVPFEPSAEAFQVETPPHGEEKSDQPFGQAEMMFDRTEAIACFLIDPDGAIRSWNPGAERLFGYSEAEVLDRPYDLLFTPFEQAAGAPAFELKGASDKGVVVYDRWHVRKDGSSFWSQAILAALRDRNLPVFLQIITDRSTQKEREDQLKEKADHLHRLSLQLGFANDKKIQSLAVLAHELRNRLSPILTAAEIISLQDEGNPDVLRASRLIQRQAEAMIQLVRDLLESTKIGAGEVRIDKRTTDLRDCATDALETARPLIEERQHRLEVSLPPNPLFVEADPRRIEQVLVNLVRNAAKYTPEGGQISLIMLQSGERAEVRVRDTGAGIAPEEVEGLFDLFAQVKRSSDQSLGGIGIGLALTKEYIELHGGSVGVKSDGIGKGSEFSVWLPISMDGGENGPVTS